jgi:hypothetical protein
MPPYNGKPTVRLECVSNVGTIQSGYSENPSSARQMREEIMSWKKTEEQRRRR